MATPPAFRNLPPPPKAKLDPPPRPQVRPGHKLHLVMGHWSTHPVTREPIWVRSFWRQTIVNPTQRRVHKKVLQVRRTANNPLKKLRAQMLNDRYRAMYGARSARSARSARGGKASFLKRK